MENKAFTGDRCRLIQRYHAIPAGEMGTLETDPKPSGPVWIQFDCGQRGLMYRHEIEILNEIDGVYDGR